VPTVSKVLNGKADVAAATRARVYEAIETTGYLSKRGALRDTSGVIELLIEGADSPWALEIIRGAETAAASRSSALIISSSINEAFSLERWMDGLRIRRSAGAIVVLPSAGPELATALRTLRIPVVLVDTAGRDSDDFPQVGATNWSGAYEATNRLIELGHRDIGLIAGPGRLGSAVERQEGYAAALRRAGIPYRAELVAEGEFRMSGGYAAGATLLDAKQRPTAIFSSSDQQAAGLYEAARERDIRIPGDLSVIGFDDTVLGRHLSPALTTIHQPLTEMAAEAVRLVGELGEVPKHRGARRIELTTYLVERRSAVPLVAE
jgi:DNA-binding LacI/PurR family transcriptional regulator